MVEPQPACLSQLEILSSKRGFVLYPYLLASEDEATKGDMHLAVADSPTTGAHVTIDRNSANKTASVPSSTLDRIFAGRITAENRPLLKLDLQGYELAALSGGKALLDVVEVILTEVSFFAQAYEPPISKLISFLDQHGFELFDIASIYGRPRDNRARQGDFLFVKRDSPLFADTRWT